MFCQIFLSQQVQRRVLISKKHSIYKFPHEFPNNFRTYSVTKGCSDQKINAQTDKDLNPQATRPNFHRDIMYT